MCGIIAAVGRDLPDIDRALGTLRRRGPDDEGSMRFPRSILGHTRLSIIDLSSTGHQPQKDALRNIAITFNGEIYNYKELRKELEQKGHYFTTQSDTEVILKCYLEYGEHCPEYLDGMFAFAIWDEEKQALFMARDRFGKKPLYISKNARGDFFVASEIKALYAMGIRGELDFQALDNYLALMYVPPWKSIYKNIEVLPPAHYAWIKNGAFTSHRYWNLKRAPVVVSYGEAKEEIKRLFIDAVRKRMVADVEVGALLSGGVDSTLVCTYAQQHTNHPLKTFSVGYGEYINELPYAKQASEKIGTDHYTLEASGEFVEELRTVIEYMDEPHADSSNFPQHLVSNLASSKVKVALSGDGADELFMGYGWYSKYWNTRKIVLLKNILFSDQFTEHMKRISIFNRNERQQLWKDPGTVSEDIVSREVFSIGGNGVQKINTFDLTTYLPGQLLTKIDRTGMMHGLEVRSPFLDYHLAEYVYNLPLEYKMNLQSGKLILKDILSEIMPREFVYRKKQGFGAPVVPWLQTGSMMQLVKETFGDRARVYDFFKKEEVRKILDDFYDRDREDVHYKIWVLLCLELWFATKPSLA